MPQKLTAQITDEELDFAIWSAERTIEYALSQRFLMYHHGEDPTRRREINVMGMKTEIICGRLLDLYWEPKIGDIERPDLGDDRRPVEVRSCMSADNPHLTIRGKDVTKFEAGEKPDCPWVCVQTVKHVNATFLHIHGWLMLSDAMRLRQETSRRGEWHVPASKLIDFRELQREVRTWADRPRFIPIPDLIDRLCVMTQDGLKLKREAPEDDAA